MNPAEVFKDLNPESPNCWAPTFVRYLVEVRRPKPGEWYLAGAKLWQVKAEPKHIVQAVIVDVVFPTEGGDNDH